MKVTIHGYVSADIEDLTTFAPGPHEAWTAQADVTLSPAGDRPGETFQVLLMSERFLLDQLAKGPVPLERTFVFREFRYEQFTNLVERLVREAAEGAETWEEFALRLNRTMEWEFDNHREEEPLVPLIVRMFRRF